MKATELKKLKESLKNVCMIYSNFKNEKRREAFGIKMYARLEKSIEFEKLSENQIVYKGAQWGGKWGNFYKAVYFRNNEFHFGSGFTNKQILG